MFLSLLGGTDGEKCTSEQFQCGEKSSKNPNGGKCIPKRWQCDYHRDCENGEDEIDCRKYFLPIVFLVKIHLRPTNIQNMVARRKMNEMRLEFMYAILRLSYEIELIIA